MVKNPVTSSAAPPDGTRSEGGPSGGARLAEPLARALGRDWRCLADAVVRAWGEEGRVDVVALHPARGVALLGLVEEGEEASPGEAAEAFRVMLRDDGFERRFPGHLPVVALTSSPTAGGPLAEAIRAAFDDVPPSTVAAGWLDWVAQRLDPSPVVPAAAAPAAGDQTLPGPRLVAPKRDEAPARVAGAGALSDVPREAPIRSVASARDGWTIWVTRLGFALAVMVTLLTAMAIFSHGAASL